MIESESLWSSGSGARPAIERRRVRSPPGALDFSVINCGVLKILIIFNNTLCSNTNTEVRWNINVSIFESYVNSNFRVRNLPAFEKTVMAKKKVKLAEPTGSQYAGTAV